MPLPKEEAAARLASLRDEDWQKKLETRLGFLGTRLRAPAEDVFHPSQHWHHRVEDNPPAALLVTMSPKERLTVFDAAAPGKAAALERMWNFHDTLPYQWGWNRRPFRAPGRPEISVRRRTTALRRSIADLVSFDQPISWFAAWGGYLQSDFGTLLAAEIDHGPEGDKVLETLLDIVNGAHPIGMIDRSAIRALLSCSRTEAWEAVEGLLVAAQRQEGLRQVIVESVDEGHPEAFTRMLRIIVDNNLTRFASVVRACGVWAGLGYEMTDRRHVDRTLTHMLAALSGDDVGSDDPDLVYATLWAGAFRNAPATVPRAVAMLKDTRPEHRFVAAYLLNQLGLPEAAPPLAELLEDEDPRVAWTAYIGLRSVIGELPDGHERLQRFADRLGKKRKLEPLVWDWLELEESADPVLSTMIYYLGHGDTGYLMSRVGDMSASVRGQLAGVLAKKPRRYRAELLSLVNDRSSWVATRVFEALRHVSLEASEAPPVEKLLTRKTGATRAAALTLLLSQRDADVLASAQRLLDSKRREQREGGTELLSKMVEMDRSRAKAQQWLGDDPSGDQPPPAETTAKVEEGAGLFDPADLTTPTPPRNRRVKATTRGFTNLVRSADELVEGFAETPVTVKQWPGTENDLYGNIRFFPQIAPGEALADGPLGDVWADWWQQQKATGFELERALVAPRLDPWRVARGGTDSKHVPKPPETNYSTHIENAMWRLWVEFGTSEGIDFLIDGMETAFASIPKRELANPVTLRPQNYYPREVDFRGVSALMLWRNKLIHAALLRPDLWSDEAVARTWGLLTWLDRPHPRAPRFRAPFQLLMLARRRGVASDADVMDALLGDGSRTAYQFGSRGLGEATRRRPPTEFTEVPGLIELADRVRGRILDVETARGDLATPLSSAALQVRSIPGAANLVRLIKALGRASLVRGWTWHQDQKNSVLSHLVRVSVPAETDTPASFKGIAEGITPKRLLEVAVYAPQWSRYVEHAIDMPGLEEAVHWIHAHTKDSRWRVDGDIKEMWAADVAERTPLSAEDLVEGAVDVAWFNDVIGVLGGENWQTLLNQAKFASGGGGHKRAEVFARALAGELTTEELAKRIKDKRHQDTVRALGLVPLPKAKAARTDEVLARYQVMQEFLRGSKKFGSQRQASEKRAAEIGLENLARTAGYPDPQRLEWAMEIHEVADLADGPVRLEIDEYEIELAVDDLGTAALTTRKGGKKLKSVPAKHRKNPDVVALRDRATKLRRQVSRMRHSLEASSIRGDEFTPEELGQLQRHPVLQPMLANLIFTNGDAMGYVGDGELVRWDGSTASMPKRLRVAHATDLLAAGDWDSWQRQCFEAERTQPFKQLFRELYVQTAAEAEDGVKSLRFAGHQVNPRQATALFGSRGWVTHPEEGPVKTYHDQGISVRVTMEGGWFTPAEVEGMTLHAVLFTKRGSWEPVALDDVPPRLFSEAMRDVDLVVSVAHMGGVDPEASASTVEMRRTLVRETAMLLEFDNVRFSNHHAVVEGKLGTYNVHLGSGVVHRQPGGAVCIIPIGAQHRGRLFLPFADDDPKTAEVVSKVVLLARDSEIKDPTILEQLV